MSGYSSNRPVVASADSLPISSNAKNVSDWLSSVDPETLVISSAVVPTKDVTRGTKVKVVKVRVPRVISKIDKSYTDSSGCCAY